MRKLKGKCLNYIVDRCAEGVSNSIDRVEAILNIKGVVYPQEEKEIDKNWLIKELSNNLNIKYVRVVIQTPKEGKFTVGRRYFDIYLVRRVSKHFGEKCFMVYLKVH